MQIVTNELNKHNIQSQGKVTDMKLDESSQAMIFQMFTGGLYSDPIGTVIREIASNCFDSHIEAKVDSTSNPVVIERGRDISGDFISFTDKGVGMSPDRVENIYGTYFKSTKRGSNDQIGGFGLGGKTPLAYTESFFIITVSEKENEIAYNQIKIDHITELFASDSDGNILYDNEYGTFDDAANIFLELIERNEKLKLQTESKIEYVYNVFEGNNVPSIELMADSPCDKPNGTTVKIPIKSSDITEFEQKTLRQLFYFENIIFKGFTNQYVSNDYNVLKGKNFLYRGNGYSDNIHVCYGKVAYPLDYSALGIDSYKYKLPIAIRLEIGELEGTGVTPSREALKYTKNNVQIIKKKIELAIAELVEMLSKQYLDVVTLSDYFKVKESYASLNLPNGGIIHLDKFVSRSNFILPNFKYNELTLPNKYFIVDHFFNVKLYGKAYSTRYSNNKKWDDSILTINNQPNIYHVVGKFNRDVKKQGYLRTISKDDNFYVLSPKSPVIDDAKLLAYDISKYGDSRDMFGNIGIIEKIPKDRGIALLNDLRIDVTKMVNDNSLNYDDVVISESYLESRKRNGTICKDMLKSTIPVKCQSSHNGSYRVTLEQLSSIKGKIYYGFTDDENLLSSASNIHNVLSKECPLKMFNIVHNNNTKNNRKHGTAFIRISRSNEKYMKMLKTAIHVKYFYKTFVSRKLDTIIASLTDYRLRSQVDNLHSIIKSSAMEVICKDTFDKVRFICNGLTNNSNNNILFNTIREGDIDRELGIDIKKLTSENMFTETLDKLTKLSNKNESTFNFIQLPYNDINVNSESHAPLIRMIKLVMVK